MAALQQTDALRQDAQQAMGQVQTGMETLHQHQKATFSVAQQSEVRSSEAVRMVEQLHQARAEDQRQFQQRMAQMEGALKQQLAVSDNAMKSIESLRQELTLSRDDARSLRQQLGESTWKLSHVSEQQKIAQQAQVQSTTESAARETELMRQANDLAARFE